ncbi:hypothetical protein OIU78_005354 [Salix suchowensis]|nr:hypothetical protein OIU78_005354 [Salix suchowensis]
MDVTPRNIVNVSGDCFDYVRVFSDAIGDEVGLHYGYGPLIFGSGRVLARSPLVEVPVAKFDTLVSGIFSTTHGGVLFLQNQFIQFIHEFKDAVHLQISFIGYVMKLLDFDAASGIFLVFLLQAFQPFLIKKLYNPADQYIGHQNKSIEKASDDAELQILACAHRREDAVAAIKVLQHSNPTKQSPLSVYGLCLEELVSSSTPLLINHQLGQKMSSYKVSRSQPSIDIFKYFKSQYKKFVRVNMFTAVSPLKQMHEDICRLSFDKACSLIILPFHKKWNSRGKMVSSNTNIRNLNITVLERAPCSVGILIDRTRTQGLSSIILASTYRVAALFFGGPDDREAVAYALRMAGRSGVHLTVMRFITPTTEQVYHDWDYMLNSEFLRILKVGVSESGSINYVEETVRDGADTSSIIKSMVGGYDLIMAGRCHQTEPQALSGLSEWMDLQELGPIGDLLSSEDITSSISVLVVQQQIMKASHSSTLN